MTDKQDDKAHSPDVSSILSSILSNPEAITKIKESISKYAQEPSGENSPPGEISEDNNKEIGKENNDVETNNDGSSPTFQNFQGLDISQKLPELLSALGSLGGGKGSLINKQQSALLLAIRPYLSEHRRGMIDTFLSMSQIGEIFKKLN